MHLNRRLPRGRLAKILGLAVLVLVAATAATVAATGAPAVRRTDPVATGSVVTVTVRPGTHSTPIPPSFLGLSFETWGLAELERHGALLARTIDLLRAPGAPPLLVRAGGNSSDRSFWNPTAARLPSWAFGITARDLRRTATLVRSAGLHLLIDLNLATAPPAVSARLAAAAAAYLPVGRIAGFEVGNEPDFYAHSRWVRELSLKDGDAAAAHLTAVAYARAFVRTARLLTAVDPAVPLAAPALGSPGSDAGWLSTLLAHPHPRLGLVTAHLYPFTACARPGSPRYPTVDRLLSPAATTGLAEAIAPVVARARRARLAVRVDELNSVSCGGRAGVSDAFATALWAPQAMFELLRAGVAGVNVHVRAEAVNGAFALTDRGLIARPLFYGMLLFARTVGPGARLLTVPQAGLAAHQLAAWVVALPGGRLHVLAINRGRRRARLLLRLPASGPATAQRLIAPGVSARGDVTLAGQHLDTAARWRGHRVTSTLARDRGGYALTVPGFSATLVTASGY